MNVREFLKIDQGIDVRISGGLGRRDDPYVLEKCDIRTAANTQVTLLRGIGLGLNELWRIIEWKPCNVGSATEVIRTEAIRFTSTQIKTETRGVYFDTSSISNHPHALHPLISWQGPTDSLHLPFELGWLHYDMAVNNATAPDQFNQTILYSGIGAKATVYVYSSEFPGNKEIKKNIELMRAVKAISNPELEDPWPVIEMGPFATKFFLSGEDITAVGVAVIGNFFVKVRISYFDDLKMRELMSSTIEALVYWAQKGT